MKGIVIAGVVVVVAIVVLVVLGFWVSNINEN